MKQRAINEILASTHEPSIDGIIVIDGHGQIQAFDSAAQDLFGYLQNEVIGQPITLLMSKSEAKEHPNYLDKARQKESNNAQKLHIERTIIGKHKQGHSIPLAITVAADTSNSVIRFTGVLQDLRKHEDQLTQIFQDLNSTTNVLKERIEFDTLLHEHGNRLLSCRAEEFVAVMENSLQSLGQFLSFDHCFFLKFDHNTKDASLWAEWRRSVGLMKSFSTRFNFPISDALLNEFLSNDTILLDEVENNKPQHITLFNFAQKMSPNGFITARITPIQNEEGALAGCIGFSVLDSNNQPSQSQIALLKVATQLLVHAWGRHQLILKSREIEQDLLNANRILAQQALNDALTGLPNRRAFDHGLLQEFDRAQRHAGSVCLLMCDIDFFKHYNDYFGHSGGDFCLQKVARILQNTFNRAGEVCTRFGGEEFAIILPSISHQEATEQAQRLLKNLLDAEIPHAPSSQQPFLTISIGIARFCPSQNYNDVQALISAADKALYFAKENGRNQLAWASEAE
jgi:diguanylate cyclase (GGDEF)-like protein/PAS domain S-box-containing protein